MRLGLLHPDRDFHALYVALASAKIESSLNPSFWTGRVSVGYRTRRRKLGDISVADTVLTHTRASDNGCAQIQSRVKGIIVSIRYGLLQGQ